MRHRPNLSERADLARDADGGLRRTFRALRPLTCAGCGALIPTNSTFMRRGPLTHSGYSTIQPHCTTCMPFDPSPTKEHTP